MKKLLMLLLVLSIISACEKNYTGKYIQWGDTPTENNKKCLKDNHIPYKIENSKIYIPEDAFDKSINTCS
ncbi:hypothetical protein [Bacillus atrophaeus]|uniref:hypothetical protein n=1 Tax=Bacillus atrophaeus TaxID=1452 RepID=UPI002280A0B9|nr:hypothetical protein [Bacillus atrophaeus]MCY8931595.1 hypothetical protein [Bacillus atrophaeus]MCY8941813.1 hypothetical protein [Bacillus atrophaeus]MCY8947387.1 hypothetical protein [Bacillus atrophaeus]